MDRTISAARPPMAEVLSPAKPRVLAVDDEPALREMLCEVLRSTGYDATSASSGSEAMHYLRQNPYDVLLTDLMMPGMDGISLLREALTERPHLIVIVMSGHGTIANAVESLQAGAMDYILKPFEVTTLLPMLSRALSVRGIGEENESRTQACSTESEKTIQELEAFAYSVSHDLRAPVRGIRGLSEVLLQDYAVAMPEEAQDLVRRISASSERAEKLISDMLDFSRLSRQPLVTEPVDLTALVQEVVTEVRQDNAGRTVTVTVGVLPICAGDRSLLRQLLVNLISNAFKFTRTRQSPTIEISSRSEKGSAIICIHDNGVGFDQTHEDKLFVVFQRLHSAAQFEGTGVGLSIVQRIIERHGGRVWAEGRPGVGATFYFSLPGQATAVGGEGKTLGSAKTSPPQ